VNQSPEIEKLAEALAKAQGQIRNADKDSTNPHFKSKYADLASVWDACRKSLSENGLSIVQLTDGGPSPVTVTTRLMHSSGQWIESSLTLQPSPSTPQGVGSALTYGRRYSLMAMVGVAPDDEDDGNAASQAPPQRPSQQYQRQPAQRQAAPAPILQAVGEPVVGQPGVDPETKNRSEKAANAICQMIAKKEFTVEEIAHHTQLSDIGAVRRAFDYSKLEDALEKLNFIKTERQMAS